MTHRVSAFDSFLPLRTVLSIPATLVRTSRHLRTIRQLEQLDDHMLKDVGLSRGELLHFKSYPRQLSLVLAGQWRT